VQESIILKIETQVSSIKADGPKNPLISVIVLTYNRKEELRKTLKTIEKQTIQDKEILVVDNGSNDGTSKMLHDEFPVVRIISMPNNSGTAGRNAGLKSVCGRILVTLDDDVGFADNKTLEQLVEIFENVNAEVVCFKILSAETGEIQANNWYHPKSLVHYGKTRLETDYISEGAAAVKRDIFMKTGYYPVE